MKAIYTLRLLNGDKTNAVAIAKYISDHYQPRSSNSDAAAKVGITLAGEAISDEGIWRGKWKPLVWDQGTHCTVKVPAASAAIIKLSTL